MGMGSRCVFYSGFFHEHLFRDYRHIYHDKTTVFKFLEEPLDTLKMKSKVLQFLTKHTSRNWSREGILLASLSFFNDIGAYRGSNDFDRLIDMLMFDFDTENIEVNVLKKRLNEAYSIKDVKVQLKEVKKVQEDFQKLLFHTDLLKQPFMDARKLSNYFQQLGIRTYTMFSGCKGLHLYVFLPKLHISNILQVTLKLATIFKDQLDLRTLDVSVSKDSLKRMDRVPLFFGMRKQDYMLLHAVSRMIY